MNKDYSVCPECLMVLGEMLSQDSLNCGCNSGYLISWWALREYASYLPIKPVIGRAYAIKPITMLTPPDIIRLLISCDDDLFSKYNPKPARVMDENYERMQAYISSELYEQTI